MPDRFDGGDESRVQALVAEVERLRGIIRDTDGETADAQDERDAARAEAERLRRPMTALRAVEAENERLLTKWSEADALWVAAKAEVERLKAENQRLRGALEKIAKNEFVTAPHGAYHRALRPSEIAKAVLDA